MNDTASPSEAPPPAPEPEGDVSPFVAWRRRHISRRVLGYVRKVLPPMSDTERDAIAAGTVWWDADLFSGKPDWEKLRRYPKPALSAEEQAFLDGPVTQLCEMLNDWQIRRDCDLPEEAWDFIRKNNFLGIIIPKAYGGLGFSALAHSAIVIKVSSRSVTGGVTVMVPNSLGPAELLLRYGTEQQRNYYLPRLARGDEIPCFALTGPEAGSDAAAIPDHGIVCYADYKGNRTLGMQGHLEQALHHAGAGGDDSRPRLPAIRSRSFDRRQGRHRHHARAYSHRSPGRRDRPPSLSRGPGVPERSHPRQGRVHSDGLGDRRPEDGGPWLAHADGLPVGGPRHFAPRPVDGGGPILRPQHGRLRTCPPSVRNLGRQVRGCRRTARPHRKPRLCADRGGKAHRRLARSRRAAFGAVAAFSSTTLPSACVNA